MTNPDVLIIGAGPVGLTLAAECLRHGVSFRIVDRASGHSVHSKALAIWSGTLECLAAAGLADDFVKAARPVTGIVFKEQGKPLAEISCVDGVVSAYPQPCILPQCETEALLIEHLQKHGVTVERNVECLGISQNASGVECQLKHEDGTIETASVSWAAGCDGARSVVRHGLPVEFEGVTEKTGFILADAKATGDLPVDRIVISFSAESAVIIFPVKESIWRIFALRPDTSDRSEPTLEEIQSHIDRAGLSEVKLSEPEWLSFFAVNERVASRNRVGRIFLLGDASHIHSPAGGQGMNTGMQDAFNLGWKLKLLASGRGSEEALSESYFAERHPVAEAVVRDTTRMLHFGIMNNVLTRTVKRIALPLLSHLEGFRKLMAAELSELKIGYDHGPLIEVDSKALAKGGFAAGTRARDAEVMNAKSGEAESLWRKLLEPGHTLAIFSGPNPGMERLEALAAEATLTGDVMCALIIWHGKSTPSQGAFPIVCDPDGSAHEAYGLHEAGWYVIRPDQYVAARGTMAETGKLRDYLRKVA